LYPRDSSLLTRRRLAYLAKSYIRFLQDRPLARRRLVSPSPTTQYPSGAEELSTPLPTPTTPLFQKKGTLHPVAQIRILHWAINDQFRTLGRGRGGLN